MRVLAGAARRPPGDRCLPDRRAAGRRGGPRPGWSACRCPPWTRASACTRCRPPSGSASSAPAASRWRGPRGVRARRDPRQHPARRAHGRDRPAAGRRAVRRARSRASAADSRRAGGAARARAAAPRRSWPTRTTRPRAERGAGPARGAPRLQQHRPRSLRPRRASPGAACAKSWDSRPDARLLGQVAQITPWKGQDTSIRMLAELRRVRASTRTWPWSGRSPSAASGVRYDNHAFLESLERLVGELELGGSVHFLGQREDVPDILARAGPVPPALMGGAVRPGHGGEHGDGHTAARDLGGRRPGAGGGRRLGPCPSAPASPRAWAAAARELLEDPGAAHAWARRGPAGGGPLPRRRPREPRCWPSIERATGSPATGLASRWPRPSARTPWRRAWRS